MLKFQPRSAHLLCFYLLSSETDTVLPWHALSCPCWLHLTAKEQKLPIPTIREINLTLIHWCCRTLIGPVSRSESQPGPPVERDKLRELWTEIQMEFKLDDHPIFGKVDYVPSTIEFGDGEGLHPPV
jgi:hypothetical protein